jgi:hypothetical protein
LSTMQLRKPALFSPLSVSLPQGERGPQAEKTKSHTVKGRPKIPSPLVGEG